MQHIVFRDLPSLLQIRHNAPRNAPLRRELALLDMNEVSSRTLSGHLRASASAGRTGGPGNFNPPVARDCTVKKTHYSKLKLGAAPFRSEEHTSELQSLMRISYAVSCLNNKNIHIYNFSS